MKHVYVASRGSGEIIAVARKRKRIREAIDADRRAGGGSRLIWKRGDWSPWRVMGDGKIVPAPYTVERFGVL